MVLNYSIGMDQLKFMNTTSMIMELGWMIDLLQEAWPKVDTIINSYHFNHIILFYKQELLHWVQTSYLLAFTLERFFSLKSQPMTIASFVALSILRGHIQHPYLILDPLL